jgi:phosphopantothenoylcysteine decarboxylase/phosphopantothenate--cysteine ligase
MAAAVADFAPTQPTNEKIKKEHGVPVIKLTPTVDILQMIADSKSSTSIPFVTVGFAAESSGLLENAQRKLREKKLDMIVANDITQPDAGFEVDTNRVTIIHADGQLEEFQLMSKDQVAQIVMERVTKFILERNDNR